MLGILNGAPGVYVGACRCMAFVCSQCSPQKRDCSPNGLTTAIRSRRRCYPAFPSTGGGSR
eukprot:6776499-Prymnesium_polylepis.1